ncbi:MAG: hypothetical protein WC755_05235 [Candidatus Woesearchaeota archaeon]|jgi:hypothetical protein
MSSKINEAKSFVVSTNVPSTLNVGDDINIDIEFKSDKLHENVTFEAVSLFGMSSKQFDMIIDDEKLNVRLTGKTKGFKEGEQDVILKIKDFQGALYTKQFKVKLIYTMSDFQYQLQELRIRSAGIVDGLTKGIVIISVLCVLIVLYFYMKLKHKFSDELIAEAKLKKDRDLAFSMLSQKQGVDNLKTETNTKIDPNKKPNLEDLKKDVHEKTELEKKTDELEKSRDAYLQRNDDRVNNYK